VYDLGDWYMKRPKWKKVEFEEIEYKPLNIKELLVEMKDISELIVDLAYSAVLFHSNDIGEEVRYLEVRMNKLNYQIRMMAMLAVRATNDAEKLAGILQIAEAAENISNAATGIVDLLAVKHSHPILPHLIKESDENLRPMKITAGSSACNRDIASLRIGSETGVHIIAIRRGKDWLYGPGKNTVLMPEDIIIGRGPDSGLQTLEVFLKGDMEVLE
jgi:uncharacterized protein with PhoU and TrkA domain